MMRTYLMAGTALLAGLASPALSRPFTAKDLATMERVSNPKISPDGRYVSYSLRTVKYDENKGANALNVIDLRGDVTKPFAMLTDEKIPAGASWSPDGQWLYFLSSNSGASQLWRAHPDGSSREQLTAFPVDIGGFVLGPDGHTLVVAADVYPDCPTLKCTKDRDDDQAKSKASGILVKHGMARSWDSYVDEKYQALYRVDLSRAGAPSEAANIASGFGADVPSDANFAISPDGRTGYFASIDPGADFGSASTLSHIYRVPLDSSAKPTVFLGTGTNSYDSPALSPDGKSLAYLQAANSGETYRRTAVMLRDLSTGRTREVAPTLDASLGGIVWSPDGRSLLANVEGPGQIFLSRIDVASGKVTPLTGNGVVSAFDASRGSVVYAQESLQSPAQLYLLPNGGTATRLTSVNAKLLAEAPLSPSEQFSFPGWNGETVYGYVTRPADYVEGKKFPVAFLIHGGPQGSFNNAWSYRWNPQVWSGMGYGVVSIDFHGSTGYGEKFAQSIVGHWGDRPLEDLQKGWAFALSRYPYLDGNRACALGGSYGGYMITWIASQWSQPWKCLVDHAGVFDVASQSVTMDSHDFIDLQFGAVPNKADWQRFNPAAFADRWKVPMLVIHGGKDFRVPTEQGIAAHNAALRAGVPTELLIFPDENHWVLKPQNSVQWYQVVKDWLDKWTAPAGGLPIGSK